MKHTIDATNVPLGRIATQAAALLNGKNTVTFVKNKIAEVEVSVVNASKLKVTGKKMKESVHKRYSGYPGGFKSETLSELRNRKPEEIIKHAVKGMLPQNKLRDRMLDRLKIYPEDSHEYQDKFMKA